MRTQLLIGAAAAAIMFPGAAFAQSTGSSEVEGDIVISASRENQGVDGIKTPDSTKARVIITNELINRGASGNSLLAALNIVPGVNFTNNDPYGSSGGNIRIRGFDGNRISLTFDGFPLNDTGNYAIFSNQQLDPELVSEVNVNLGTTDIDSPTASAAGGTINYRTIIPTDKFSVTLAGTGGDFNRFRAFGLVQTGVLTSFGTKAFFAVSKATNDKFKGPGDLDKLQFNGGIYQPIGSNGDFFRISGHYNRNRNTFYNNPNVTTLRTAFGTTLFPTAGTPSAPLVINDDFSDAQKDLFKTAPLEYVQTCLRPAGGPGAQVEPSCTTTNYRRNINPSNTGNVRINSRFTLADKLTLFLDGSYQYVLAHGGGYTSLQESNVRAKGSLIASPGVDYNGDGDYLDTVGFFAPNITNTRRYTGIASLLYQFDDNNRVRVAYTFDRGRHRQTGEWGFFDGAGKPQDPFSGRNGTPVRAADGFILQQRDRLSIALLNQVSGEYIGKFFDQRLTVQLGVRAPFFQRNLQTFCPIQARDGFAFCTSQPIAARGTNPATGPVYVNQGDVVTAPTINAGANPVYAPFKANYKYSRVLPSAGFTLKIIDNLSIFGSYAQGFSAPRTDNLYRAPLVTTKPETTDAFDLGARYSSGIVQLQATAWKIYYKNRIVTSFDQDQGISVDRNVGSVDSKGFDVGASVRPIKYFAFTGTLSYTDAKLKSNVQVGNFATLPTATPIFAFTAGKQVVETPKWQVGGRAQAYLGPVEIGLQGKYVDKRFATDVNDVVAPSYTTFDLDVRVDMSWLGLGKKTYFQLNAQNLFDKFYYGSISSQINAFSGASGGASCTATPATIVPATTSCSTSQPSFSIGYPRTFTGSLHVEF